MVNKSQEIKILYYYIMSILETFRNFVGGRKHITKKRKKSGGKSRRKSGGKSHGKSRRKRQMGGG